MPPDMMRCQTVARALNGLSESTTFSRCSCVLARSPVVNTSLAAFQYHSGVPILAVEPEEQELNKTNTPRNKKRTTTDSRVRIARLLFTLTHLEVGWIIPVPQLELGCKRLASWWWCSNTKAPLPA